MKKIIVNDEKMHDFFSQWNNNLGKLFIEEDCLLQGNNSIFLPQNLTLNYEVMKRNLHVIFGESANVGKQICLFDDVLEFLQQIVQVDGADRLFSKHFFDIEWNMFLEADFEKSEMKVYRDHFVHQIRNAYLGYYLIWEMGLYDNIEKAITKYNSMGFSQLINIHRLKEEPSCRKENFYKRVIKKTWFLTALFHDIGYPLAYHQRYSAKMDKYMPYLRVLDNRRQMDFVELSAMLSDTYLFKMIDYEELKMKYEQFDHEFLSAICLLLNYYHTGTIHRLSNADRCSIELAAYAIFAHTRKYSIQEDGEKKSKLIRLVFVEDPISYILRLCDDLQEWARVYFIVGENSNALICDECKKMLKRDENGKIYECKCDRKLKKITAFNYRKINLVKVCNSLKIHDDGKKITFELDYDLVKLLQIIGIDMEYAKYRSRELTKLTELLKDQALLPKIEIKYFLSNDDMIIKIEIFRVYIENNIDNDINDISKITCSFMNEHSEKIYADIIRNLELKNDENMEKALQCEMQCIVRYLHDHQECNKVDFICDTVSDENYMENLYLYKMINDFNNENKNEKNKIISN